MRDWIRARCIIYLEEKEKKKKKEMETLVLVIATVQEYPIRDTRNRSKRKSQQRHDTGEEREKKRTSSYLLRQCFQSRNLDTFFFATGFTV